jgi:hypothetical protein
MTLQQQDKVALAAGLQESFLFAECRQINSRDKPAITVHKAHAHTRNQCGRQSTCTPTNNVVPGQCYWLLLLQAIQAKGTWRTRAQYTISTVAALSSLLG